MTHPVFSKLPDRSVEPILDDLDGWKKVDGEPSMKTWIEYTYPKMASLCLVGGKQHLAHSIPPMTLGSLFT